MSTNPEGITFFLRVFLVRLHLIDKAAGPGEVVRATWPAGEASALPGQSAASVSWARPGAYDQSTTKVLHLSTNPASAARQRLREDRARLQEECGRLRGLVHALESGRPAPADLEVAVGLPSSEEVAELKKQVESAELKNQRLKEVFQTKIQEFRKVCYTLTGYQIDVTTESQYRLTSMYAEHKADCLIFKVGPVVAACSAWRGPDSLRKAGQLGQERPPALLQSWASHKQHQPGPEPASLGVCHPTATWAHPSGGESGGGTWCP
ncbi:hypothetical protein MC885_007074, partial [Smutsia gigantea]